MWIKQITSSLYVSLFYRMLLSALFSIILFLLLINITGTIISKQNELFNQERDTEIQVLADAILHFIEEQQLTFRQAEQMNFDDDTIYNVEFESSTNNLFEEFRFFNNQAVYEVSFVDADGFLVINSQSTEITENIYYALTGIFSLCLFFILSLYLIFEELSYIKVIDEGIQNIAHEDILYKIPILKNNELTRLATNINTMSETVYQKIQKERQDELNQRLLITNMSHDLRTPLTSINGYIDIVKSKLSPDDEVYTYINIAKENGMRLEKLINDLFLYSKLISGDVPIHLQSMDINLILNQILEIRTENIIFTPDVNHLMTQIDPEKFHRVLDNLITNASRYGVKDAPISISSHLQDETILILIQNQTDEDLSDKIDLLQNRLYTANEDRANGSSGLGLSIVTELLKSMHGTLELSIEDKNFIAQIKLMQP